MLPTPLIDHIPKEYRDGGEAATLALCTKVDAILEELKGSIALELRFFDPVGVPASGLDALGDMMAADLAYEDSSTVKRKKITEATRLQKNLGTWRESVKVLVDAQVGGDSKLYSGIRTDEWVVLGDGLETTGNSWTGMGGEDPLLEYGIRMIGGDEIGMAKGYVTIDVDSSALTPAEVAMLVASIRKQVPAYFRVTLGYMSGLTFVAYADGTIG